MPPSADETGKTQQGTGAIGASAAWSHISFAPPDAWVEESSYDASLKAKEGTHLTYLLWMRQVHVEQGKSFHATANRLETPLAVQHQSQWRLDFDPRYQQLALHWLRVVRNGQSVDQLQRERMRVIQRESQLDHLVIDGNWTLLVVLDDVRPGDIIESAYSVTNRHPIRPEGCETLFAVPPTVLTGRYELSLRFDSARPNMAWKASSDAPSQTVDKTSDGLILWKWRGQQTVLREPELNQPSTFLDYIWVQVSDLTDWQHLTSRVAQAWEQTINPADLGALVGLPRPAEMTPAEIHRIVRHLQDEFRYLSVDLESGGWIPASPDVAARRRYGDCKDLAWLATVLLRNWGVKARPILVGTGLRERIGDLLPMTLLLNHAVLEVEIGGKTRWFDLTMRLQGGGFDDQPISWFQLGLPVDVTAQAQVKQPGLQPPAIYAYRETIMLDTRRNKPSSVEVRVRAEGWNAENLRHARQAQGVDEFSNERLKVIQRRYAKISRTGPLQWRDNREQNTCELVETFEINDVVYLDERGERALFDGPSNLLIQSIPVPDETSRRGPWDMPYPVDLRYEIVIKAAGMNSGSRRRRRWEQPEFIGTLDEPRRDGSWSKAMRFISRTPEVSAERISGYRRELDQFLQATTWRLYLPKETPCPAGLGDQWGKLPAIDAGISAYVQVDDPATFPDAKNDPDNPDGKAIVHEERRRWTNPVEANKAWYLVIPIVLLLSTLSRTCSTTTIEPPYQRAYRPTEEESRIQIQSLHQPPFQTGRGFDLPPSSVFFQSPSQSTITPLQPITTDVADLGPNHPPLPRSKVEPLYPAALNLSNMNGQVIVEFEVDTSGHVQNAKVIESSHSLFSQSALNAVSKWEFYPAEKDGVAISQTVRLPITFQAHRRSGASFQN